MAVHGNALGLVERHEQDAIGDFGADACELRERLASFVVGERAQRQEVGIDGLVDLFVARSVGQRRTRLVAKHLRRLGNVLGPVPKPKRTELALDVGHCKARRRWKGVVCKCALFVHGVLQLRDVERVAQPCAGGISLDMLERRKVLAQLVHHLADAGNIVIGAADKTG